MPDIQRADPLARRRALLIISIAAVIGAVGVLLLERYRPRLEQLFADKAHVLLTHPEIVAAIFFVLMLPVYVATVYLWRLGATIVASRRFPAPGQPVVRDTVILSDRRAVYRGRVIQTVALVLLLAGLALPAVIWYIFWSLTRAS